MGWVGRRMGWHLQSHASGAIEDRRPACVHRGLKTGARRRKRKHQLGLDAKTGLAAGVQALLGTSSWFLTLVPI